MRYQFSKYVENEIEFTELDLGNKFSSFEHNRTKIAEIAKEI